MARAEASVFWPGITADIHHIRSTCMACNRMAPSQPKAPPADIMQPSYPFQLVCADYFMFKGKTYLIIVGRYSNWPIIQRAEGGSSGLIKCLRQTFATYGIPDELASDGGKEFTAQLTKQFLVDWGVRHRISSVAFPHSNCRAEIGVKTAKRIISQNTDGNGSLNVDAFQKAILSYRNTPSPDTKLSPAQCVFGRPIRDVIPIHRNKYKPHRSWTEALNKREDAMSDRHNRMRSFWSEHTQPLPPLQVGDYVRIQNQIGTNPLKWDKTGRVVEVKQHHQYNVKVDGSNRLTLRNRKFLRKYTPILPNSNKADLMERLRYVQPYHKTSKDPSVVMVPSTLPSRDCDDQPSHHVDNDDERDQGALRPVQNGTEQRDTVISVPKSKRHLALRCLDPYNKKGLKED